MTLRFILDENIIICAQLCTNDGGEEDLTCVHLLTQIIEICHTIVTDFTLWGKYLSQLIAYSGQIPKLAPYLSEY
jgi:hypothetical protein